MATRPLDLLTHSPLFDGVRHQIARFGATPKKKKRSWRENLAAQAKTLANLPKPSPALLARAPKDLVSYGVDFAQRGVLYTEIMRQRGDQYFEHIDAGQPPVLEYDWEMIMDGADLDDPVNYFLVRVLPGDHVIDETKRPFIIIDPRAGHGPGIGGFKRDSQVGVALKAGHAVYFVAFRDRPEPGQCLEDVKRAEARFIEHVDAIHPDAPHPAIIGNCQAGWAVAILAAVNPGVTGPIILNGAPMSYWAGADNNPMRYLGGLMGGTWIASMCADLGNGLFDGAYLVQNFENLNPANTLFGKQYNVWSRVDTEGPRYLGFERWWNGFFLMNDEEMDFIVDNLFIGNKLGAGKIALSDGQTVSLRDIKAPIVVFASGGDDITPPQQALNWIADVYPNDEAILEDEQVIVYTLHEDIGHLGIFVSGRVARREHTAIIGAIEAIEDLPPGLYEMVIEDGSEQPFDTRAPYAIRFVERSIQDILGMDDSREDERAFATLAAVSELNAAAYRTWMRPWVRLFSNEISAELLRRSLPARAQHEFFSSRNPLMLALPRLANSVEKRRVALPKDNSFLKLERAFTQALVDGLNAYRDARDDGAKLLFEMMYGPMGLGAIFSGDLSAARDDMSEEELARREKLHARVRNLISTGGFIEGFSRIAILLSRADRDIEPLLLEKLREVARTHPRFEDLDEEELLARFHEQYVISGLMPNESRAAISELLPGQSEREEALALAVAVVLGEQAPNRAEKMVLDSLMGTLLHRPHVH